MNSKNFAKRRSVRNLSEYLLPCDSWKKREARYWLYGATDKKEEKELERWLFDYPDMSPVAESLASSHYERWAGHIRENGVYADFSELSISKPQDTETLLAYFLRLKEDIENQVPEKKAPRLARNSFIFFVRCIEENDIDEVAFIEQIFPEDRDTRDGKIIQRIRPQTRAISEEMAGDIIKSFAYQLIHGNPIAQHYIAEALALCWLCLIASRLRMPTSLERVHATEITAVLLRPEHSELLVPTTFGDRKVRMSHHIAKFFHTISLLPSQYPRKTILQGSLHDLRRPFAKVLKGANINKSLKDISFLTFLTPPHRFGERYDCIIRNSHSMR